MCSSGGQSNKEQFVNIGSNEQSNTTCTRNTGDKNCQANKSAHRQPVKSAMDMQSNGSAVPIQYKMSKQQITAQEDDKNCQVTRCNKKKNQLKQVKSMCFDRNCQVNMRPVKPEIDMQLPKPAIPYKYKRLCSDKNCQSTRCFKKKCPVRPVCDDKNCQSANIM